MRASCPHSASCRTCCWRPQKQARAMRRAGQARRDCEPGTWDYRSNSSTGRASLLIFHLARTILRPCAPSTIVSCGLIFAGSFAPGRWSWAGEPSSWEWSTLLRTRSPTEASFSSRNARCNTRCRCWTRARTFWISAASPPVPGARSCRERGRVRIARSRWSPRRKSCGG